MAKKKVKARGKVLGEDRGNRRVVMTCAPAGSVQESGLIATGDPSDRAHDVRDGVPGSYLLVSAVGLNGAAVPRRYPPCYMHEVVEGRVVETGEGAGRTCRVVERAVAVVSDETVFDETAQAERWLQNMGLRDGSASAVAARTSALARMDDIRIRDLIAYSGRRWRCPTCGQLPLRPGAWWCETCQPAKEMKPELEKPLLKGVGDAGTESAAG